jgi:Cytochrome c554 and c-prime
MKLFFRAIVAPTAGFGNALLLLLPPFVLMFLGGARCLRAQAAAPEREGYAGDAACVTCHAAQALSYKKTAHHLTSQQATRSTVLGSFAEGSNQLPIAEAKTAEEAKLSFHLQAMDRGLYQTAVAEREDQRLTHSERFDVVIGSGVRGQSFLYWAGQQLFELPVSYWTEGQQWINSPGYRDGTANFKRHVDPRCLECHVSFARALSNDPQTNVYDRASLVMGISCESCHGAGAAHVKEKRLHGSGGEASTNGAILNPARFERDRQVDQCALCHNGTQPTELLPAFSYRPGEDLRKYLAPNPLDAPDVHGNQVGLLKRSRCFLDSAKMSCSTCHDVHAPEKTLAVYSVKCMTCHQWQSCGEAKRIGTAIRRNCIDCHMPMKQTAAIVSVTAGREVRASIRTHWIKVYPADAAVKTSGN